jgi:hypothetical protein
MSVESWSQGQSNQRQRLIIETAEANVPVSRSMFAEPGASAAPPAGGDAADASMKEPKAPGEQQPPDQPAEPPQPPKGE